MTMQLIFMFSLENFKSAHHHAQLIGLLQLNNVAWRSWTSSSRPYGSGWSWDLNPDLWLWFCCHCPWLFQRRTALGMSSSHISVTVFLVSSCSSASSIFFPVGNEKIGLLNRWWAWGATSHRTSIWLATCSSVPRIRRGPGNITINKAGQMQGEAMVVQSAGLW